MSPLRRSVKTLEMAHFCLFWPHGGHCILCFLHYDVLAFLSSLGAPFLLTETVYTLLFVRNVLLVLITSLMCLDTLVCQANSVRKHSHAMRYKEKHVLSLPL